MAGAGYKLFNTGDVLTAAQVNTYLQEQTVMVFASSTARTTALSGVLAEGMMSYLQDTNSVEVYNGSSWVALASGDLTEIVAGTGITVTSGTGPIPTVALTTPVAATNGGTAQSTYTTGDLLYASATNTLAKRAIGSTDQVLKVSGGIPTWAVDPTTDVVTTAGDLIYGTGADAVTRLGIGTAGQVLTVNSGATAPEWATASTGGLVKIAETSFSAVSTGSFTGCFSSTYDSYVIVIKQATSSVAGANLRLRLRTGGSDVTTNYNTNYIELGASTYSRGNLSNVLASIYIDNTSGNDSSLMINLYNPFNAVRTTYSALAQNQITTTQYWMGGGHNQSTSYADLGVSADSGNFTAKVAIYGLS